MSKRYWGALGVFAFALVVIAGAAGTLISRVPVIPLVILVLAAYGLAVLLDVLPPGSRSSDGDTPEPDDDQNEFEEGEGNNRVHAASVGALAGLAAVMFAVTGVSALQDPGPPLAPVPVADVTPPAAEGDDADADDPPIVPASATSTPDADSPTATPTAVPTATPTPTPTPTHTPQPTPEAPASPFAYCTHLEGSRYTCGDQPWRVICTPDTYFFDPEGVVPSPIPEEWEGWSETTLTERLEYIHGACE